MRLSVPLLLVGLCGCHTERASLQGQRIGLVGLARQSLHGDFEPPRLIGVLAGDGTGTTATRTLALTPALHAETGPVAAWCAALSSTCSAWVPIGSTVELTLPPVAGPHVVHLWARDSAGNISLPVSTSVRLEPEGLAAG